MPIANKNIKHLIRSFEGGKRGAILEGSSRSGKTWSGVDFIIYVTSRSPKPLVINVIKETYSSFKTTIFDDINNRFPMANLMSPVQNVKDCSSFRLFGSKVNFMGADQPSKYHGAGCDFFWINESLDVEKVIFDQLEMRCRQFWWMDYNPKHSIHWVFDLEKREDVSFCHSTLLDNPHVSNFERRKILSYDPNNPANVEAGTADDYMWAVYGLGLRASPTGLVYPNVTWIDQFPDDIEDITYGLDFGYTNSPTALAKVGRNGMNLYAQKLLYTPIDNPNDLSEILKNLVPEGQKIWADSADPVMIADLRRRGITIFGAVKKPGSVEFGISFLKQHKLHLVNDPDVRKEQENYKWRVVQGITLNEPNKEFDHCFTGDTLVETINGTKRIDEIKVSELVLTRNGYAVVENFFDNGCREICEYEIKFRNFAIRVKCTPDHKFLINGKWQSLDAQRSGTTLVLLRNLTEKYSSYIRVNATSRKETADYTGSFGNTTTGKYQPGTRFITSTGIRTTTPLKTSNSLMDQCTIGITYSGDTRRIPHNSKSFTRPGLRPLRNGTLQRTGVNGTSNMLLSSISDIRNTENTRAKFAHRRLLPKQNHSGFAQISVRRSTAGTRGLIMRQGFVQCAKKSSGSADFQNNDFAVSHVVQSIRVLSRQAENVYDLQVRNDHEYFANGILVHNCWDAIRYATVMEFRTGT